MAQRASVRCRWALHAPRRRGGPRCRPAHGWTVEVRWLLPDHGHKRWRARPFLAGDRGVTCSIKQFLSTCIQAAFSKKDEETCSTQFGVARFRTLDPTASSTEYLLCGSWTQYFMREHPSQVQPVLKSHSALHDQCGTPICCRHLLTTRLTKMVTNHEGRMAATATSPTPLRTYTQDSIHTITIHAPPSEPGRVLQPPPLHRQVKPVLKRHPRYSAPKRSGRWSRP